MVMGAGRGKSRRAGVMSQSGKLKWVEFAETVGVKEGNFYQYYLGHRPSNPTDADYEKTMFELFADAVSIGAISLPNPYEIQDFEFKVTPRSDYIEVSLKNKPLFEDVYFPPNDYDPGEVVNNDYSLLAIEEIDKSIARLFLRLTQLNLK